MMRERRRLEIKDLARPDTCNDLVDSVSGWPALRRDRSAIHKPIIKSLTVRASSNHAIVDNLLNVDTTGADTSTLTSDSTNGTRPARAN
jgi:hypothetical protein